MTFEKNEFNIMIMMRLAEGLLITLVKEIDNRNIKAITTLEKILKGIFQELHIITGCNMVMFKPR
ncbi:unnamed protein product [Diatraea saccharalis]|uniref:Uncharacterized protein n=1 Tax=Diatraea saccharalis TaxID=40085 RepID=A0A9N9RFG6_9NEOP|nr:unnamed protein product [Diatraea saccharalis]